MTQSVRILFFGGAEEDFALSQLVLRRAIPELSLVRISDVAGFAEALINPDFRLVITDYHLGWADALSLLTLLRSRSPQAPIIMFTDKGNEELAAEARDKGVDVYLPKNPKNFLRLPDVVSSLLARAESKSEAARQETRLQSILDRSEVGTFRSTLDGKILDYNPAFLRITGLNQVGDLGHFNLHELGHLPGEWSNLLRQLKESGYLHEPALQLRRVDGQTLWIALTQVLNVTPAGESVVDGLLVDITDRKLLEQKLEQHVGELARSNKDLEQFAYTASHELQEPLRTVERYSKLLAQENLVLLGSDAKEYLDFILNGTKRMQALVTDLLSYARVVSQGRPFQTTDCEGLLQQVLSNLQGSIQESQAIITHDKLPSVTADSSQLASLFQNLLANAIKFRGPAQPLIHISAKHNNGEWMFGVHDNGIGFEPAQKERVFGIFQRLHTNAEYPGTGVGLAVCKRIVERHAGRIWAESDLGKGSTFYFSIPDKSPEPATP